MFLGGVLLPGWEQRAWASSLISYLSHYPHQNPKKHAALQRDRVCRDIQEKQTTSRGTRFPAAGCWRVIENRRASSRPPPVLDKFFTSSCPSSSSSRNHRNQDNWARTTARFSGSTAKNWTDFPTLIQGHGRLNQGLPTLESSAALESSASSPSRIRQGRVKVD